MTNRARFYVEDTLKEFPWWNYGLDNVGSTLEDFDLPDWVRDLATDILEALHLD